MALDGPAWRRAGLGPGRLRDALRVRARAAGARLARRGRRARARRDLAGDGRPLRRRALPRRALPPQAPVAGARAGRERVRRAADRRDPRRPARPPAAGDGALPGRRGRRRRVELVGPERRGAARRCCARRASRAWRSCTASRCRTGSPGRATGALRGPRFRAQQGRVVVHAHRQARSRGAAVRGRRPAGRTRDHARALEHERRVVAGAQPARQRRAAGLELDGREPRAAAPRLAKVISAPSGVTWRLRSGRERAAVARRGRTVAWTDQPLPSASSSKPPRGRSGQSKRASVFGSAQFSRPPWTEASESTAMNGTTASGPRGPSSSDGEREHLVVRPDRRLAVADQRADGDGQARRRAQRGRQPLGRAGRGAVEPHDGVEHRGPRRRARTRRAAARRRRRRADSATPRRPGARARGTLRAAAPLLAGAEGVGSAGAVTALLVGGWGERAGCVEWH